MDSKSVIDMALTFSDLTFSQATAVKVDDNDEAEADRAGSEPVIDDAPIRPFAYRDPIGKGATSDISHPNRRRSDAVTRGK